MLEGNYYYQTNIMQTKIIEKNYIYIYILCVC